MDVKFADFVIHSLWILAASIAVVVSAKKTLNGLSKDIKVVKDRLRGMDERFHLLDKKFAVLVTSCTYCKTNPSLISELTKNGPPSSGGV